MKRYDDPVEATRRLSLIDASMGLKRRVDGTFPTRGKN